jgi:hypothetical protein
VPNDLAEATDLAQDNDPAVAGALEIDLVAAEIDPAVAALSGPAVASIRVQGLVAEDALVAATASGISDQAALRARKRRAGTPASAVTVVVVVVAERERVAAVAVEVVADTPVAVVAAVVAGADGDRTLRSSTTSRCSAISRTALATIASLTTAATKPMSA